MTRQRPSIASWFVAGLFSLLTSAAALGCDPGLGVPTANRPPTADARVMGMTGQNAVVDYNGTPVEITLDASNSKDLDGTIKTYRWLSGTKRPGAATAAAGSGATAGSAASDEDGGTAPSAGGLVRWTPPGADEEWPDDTEQPKVTLPEGEYVFVLWVTDNKNVTSMPSTLKVTVRRPLDPAVLECTTKTYAQLPAVCKACICSFSDACRDTLTNMTVCDATCWGLLSCIATKCPTYPMTMDTGCLVANCSASLGGATGAGMIAPCVRACPTECRSM
jgi:hypothetical protein